jgi:lysophospholipase L1-like esterase
LAPADETKRETIHETARSNTILFVSISCDFVDRISSTVCLISHENPHELQSIEENLASIAELARAHGIRVVLSSVMPVSDYEKTADGQPRNQTTRRPPETIKALNEWMKKYAVDNKFTYLDYYSAMVDDKGFLKDELSNDGLHPNVQGYQVMNPLAEKAIEAALKRKK